MKNLFSIRFLALVAVNLFVFLSMSASDYIAIGKDGNVYDEASAKYITVNQNNDNVSVVPGMVFPTTEHSTGWYKIEYSPGLHAFIPEQIVAASFNTPQPGTYDIINNPGQKLTVTADGDNWTASSNGKSYKGIKNENILVFFDNMNNQAFSLVDIGNGPVAVTYDNNVTHFF